MKEINFIVLAIWDESLNHPGPQLNHSICKRTGLGTTATTVELFDLDYLLNLWLSAKKEKGLQNRRT